MIRLMAPMFAFLIALTSTAALAQEHRQVGSPPVLDEGAAVDDADPNEAAAQQLRVGSEQGSDSSDASAGAYVRSQDGEGDPK